MVSDKRVLLFCCTIFINFCVLFGMASAPGSSGALEDLPPFPARPQQDKSNEVNSTTQGVFQKIAKLGHPGGELGGTQSWVVGGGAAWWEYLTNLGVGVARDLRAPTG